jgi:BirA family transcriptional regulator, biotin operon repressor / biotin---[acetyl-CoA-carboxylase] ligase
MTEHLKTLIRILRDGQFHSGEELGKALGLTRSAVWKLIQQFPAWDIEIESRTNKGYRIPNGLVLLNAEHILSQVTDQHTVLPSNIEILDEISSTNDYLKAYLKDGLKQNSVKINAPRICFAEKQTAGRGRLGRQWVSPYARNISLSILWPFQKEISQLSGLSLAIAVAIGNALKDYGIQEKIGLKWPNDIYWDNKKLAGILIELSGETHSVCNTIIGVGLNIDMPLSMQEHIERPYIDIATLTNNIPDRNQLAGLLLNRIIAALILFDKKGFSPFLAQWQALDISLGKPATIITPAKKILGISRGIDENGFFLLEEKSGLISHFSGGEVSLRF